MTPELKELEALAREAGEILRAGFGQSQRIDYKGTIDLVTETDHRSEDYLIGEIKRRYPQHRVIAEESGSSPGDSCCVWHIDPLDGTVNFAHGLPFFCVSIAYVEEDQIRLGVVYDPIHDECFSAALGGGAWLNGAPLHVSNAADLDHALLVTGFPYDIRTNPNNNLDLYALLARHSHGVRRFGSAALDLCYLAAGRVDGYWEIRINSYDIAAGALVAREAGATVTRLDGDPNLLTAPHSVLSAANPTIHAQMLAMIRSR